MEILIGFIFVLGCAGILKGIESFKNQALDIIIGIAFNIFTSYVFGKFLMGVIVNG